MLLSSSPKILTPPVFEDKEKTRIAALLNVIVLGVIFIIVLHTFSVVLFVANPLTSIWANIVVLGMLFLIREISRRGHVYPASFIFCISLWLVLILVSMSFEGVKDLLYISILVVIIATSLLLGARVAAVVTAATILLGFVQVMLNNPSNELNRYWVGSSTIFISSLLLFYLADRSIKQALKEARDSADRTNFVNQALYTEIASHKRTTAALEESEERYRLLLENSPIGVSVYTLPDLTIRYVNPAAVSLLGASSAAEIVGLSSADFAASESADYAAEKRDKVVAGATVNDNFWVQGLNGKKVLIESTTINILYEGKPATLSVFQDITERKKAQDSLIQAELIRAEVEKERHSIQQRENFVTMISHQFRNPLAVILASKEIMENYHERLTPEGRKEHLGRIGHEALYMKGMLEDLLTISKGSAGMLQFQPYALELTAFCTQLIQESQANYPTHHFIFEGQVSGIYLIDDKLLRHALTNLLSNAVKYSPQGSDIQLKLRREEDMAQLMVRDHGMGIPLEDQPHLFETFFRASNVRKIQGTGLGLSIVKTTIETHGGSVGYQSPPDGGSLFTIQIPLCSAQETG